MDNDLDKLNEKLRKARGTDEASIQKQKSEDNEMQSKQGIQAGVEFVGAIFIPSAVGYGIDQWLDTQPLFMLILFFLGIFTGFYNVYRLSQKLGTGVGNKTCEKVEENGLHSEKKDAKTTPEQ